MVSSCRLLYLNSVMVLPEACGSSRALLVMIPAHSVSVRDQVGGAWYILIKPIA